MHKYMYAQICTTNKRTRAILLRDGIQGYCESAHRMFYINIIIVAVVVIVIFCCHSRNSARVLCR